MEEGDCYESHLSVPGTQPNSLHSAIAGSAAARLQLVAVLSAIPERVGREVVMLENPVGGVDYWEDQAEAMDLGEYGNRITRVKGIQAVPVKHWSTPWRIVEHPKYQCAGKQA